MEGTQGQGRREEEEPEDGEQRVVEDVTIDSVQNQAPDEQPAGEEGKDAHALGFSGRERGREGREGRGGGGSAM